MMTFDASSLLACNPLRGSSNYCYAKSLLWSCQSQSSTTSNVHPEWIRF